MENATIKTRTPVTALVVIEIRFECITTSSPLHLSMLGVEAEMLFCKVAAVCVFLRIDGGQKTMACRK
jgi:hypothetical protein